MSAVRAADLGTVVERTLAGLRRDWRALAIWCVIPILLSAAGLAMMRPMMAVQLAAARGDMSGFGGGSLLRFGAIWLLMMALLLVLIVGAMRSVLAPAAGRAAYLRFGGDELRVAAVMLLIGIGSYVGMLVLMVAIIAVAGVLAAMTGTAGAVAGVVIGGIGVVLAVGLAVYVAVRLSLAVPMTLRRGRITLRPAWRLGRGRFWYLFGGYLLMGLMTLVALTPGMAMQLGDMTAAMTAGSDPDAAARAITAMLARQADRPLVWTLAIMIVTGIGNGIGLAVQGTMAAQLLIAVETAEDMADASVVIG